MQPKAKATFALCDNCNLSFFEKTAAKKIELLNFKSKFQNQFSSCDKSNNEKKEPQPYTLTQEKNHLRICKTF